MSDKVQSGDGKRIVRIWDLPTRLFHWALVLLIALSYATGEFGGFNFTSPFSGNMVANMTVHMWSGLGILTLVLFRIVWGIVGSSTARFSTFVKGPGAVFGYLGGVVKRSTAFIAGHNPAGALVVVLMLLLLLAQAATGLFSKEDDFFGIAGPLNSLVSEETATSLNKIHHRIWGYLELLIVLHIAANIFYWLILKQNLIGAMLTGKKSVDAATPVPELRFAPTATAVIVLALAAAVVWGITKVGS